MGARPKRRAGERGCSVGTRSRRKKKRGGGEGNEKHGEEERANRAASEEAPGGNGERQRQGLLTAPFHPPSTAPLPSSRPPPISLRTKSRTVSAAPALGNAGRLVQNASPGPNAAASVAALAPSSAAPALSSPSLTSSSARLMRSIRSRSLWPSITARSGSGEAEAASACSRPRPSSSRACKSARISGSERRTK